MPKINLLPKEISELIAAGEVVERPASVVKELIENSIDAGSKHITVEITRGGISLIRITDDGCGINSADVPLAFKRHATSKIKSADDLNSIITLGFRGEALCATACVSRVEMFTKSAGEELGTHYVIEGSEEIVNEESGCPGGTTVIIRDLFFNTPARMKFLKKDASEGTAVAAAAERAALSHPETAFKFIREGKLVFSTSGDGKLYSAVYSVLGREFASSLIEVSGSTNGVAVSGYTCKPVFCRQSRASQYTFLNGRLIRSGTVTAAAEQAYRGSAMSGKYPAFVLCLETPPQTVDVNVHPAKTEVRFSDEKRIFDAVYYAVKGALASGDTRPQINPRKGSEAGKMSADEYRQNVILEPEKPAAKPVSAENNRNPSAFDNRPPLILKNDTSLPFERKNVKRYIEEKTYKEPEKKIFRRDVLIEKDEPDVTVNTDVNQAEGSAEPPWEKSSDFTPLVDTQEVKYVGEAYSTYIIVQKGESIYLIDKHAAHERIIFNRLKENENTESQALLDPVLVRLGEKELDGILDNLDALSAAGFEIEDFGNSSVIVRAVPSMLTGEDVQSVVTEAADSLSVRGGINIEKLDSIYHTVACKAAIKAGYVTSVEEQLSLAKQVLLSKDVMYCPHGRPVAFEIKKKELEKQFGRIQ